MSLRFSLVILCVASLLVLDPGCGGGRPSTSTSGGPGTGPQPPGGGGPLRTPLLLAVEPDPLTVSVGDLIKLIGVNFHSDLSKNRVSFISGTQRIPGIPVRIDFPTDGNPQNGLEAELQVVVPGGISSGNVEVNVDGIDAGARGYEARPQIMAWTLGRNETQEFLRYVALLGFDAQASFVKLYGLNFSEIENVQLEDAQGGSYLIQPSVIERNPPPPPGTPTGLPPTGYTTIGFSLKDNRGTDARLNFIEGKRDNLRVRVKGPAGLSNMVEIPVHSDANPNRLGAVINGIKVPTGVRTGPVRIHYTMYDRVPDTNYEMEVSWKLASEEDSFFRLAKPHFDDPEHSGNKGVVAGYIGHTSQRRLLPGGGAFRTFTWDVNTDAEFQRLIRAPVDGKLPPRYWPIQFQIKPVVEPNNPAGKVNPNHRVLTPAILYYSLDDRPGDDVSAQRAAEFVEAFENDVNEDRLTNAEFGPPNTPGALVGKVTSGLPDPFGEGTAQLLLKNTSPDELAPDAVDQYYEISTDQMTITYKQISDNNGTPCDPFDDQLAGGGRGQRPEVFDNPGQSKKEFHLATFVVDENVKVFVRGSNPFVLRLSGTKDQPDEDVFVVRRGAKIDLNGCNGEDGPRPPGNDVTVQGRGGNAGPGAGRGGDGATFGTGLGGILLIVHAQRGERDGGEGGETTGAIDIDANGKSSVFGAPGGGGGNRTAGRKGDSGAPKPTRFNPPRAGNGGEARGDSRLLFLSPGSGGGGGGATVGVANNTSVALNAGAGGGGGGGAIHIVASGRIVMDSTSTIEANGGAGGKSSTPKPNPPVDGAASPSAGGGGSGGCVFLQAKGSVQVLCENLQVHGGLGGGAKDSKQNQIPGSGDGGEGWVRVESAQGGAPTCSPLTAETKLSSDATKTANRLVVDSTNGFPGSGTVVVVSAATGEVLEEVPYLSITPTSFEGAVRTASSVLLTTGSPVFLKGSIFPYKKGILFDDAIVTSADAVETGRGRDQEVHIRFEPSVDPITGKPLLDPDTGQVTSIWIFDTDLGVVKRPGGDVAFEVSAIDTDPGFLDCSRLVIDENAVLRGVGSRPLRISVSGQADIGGTIDVSGLPGGILRFDAANNDDPQPGLGGKGGPGGGDGGPGGRTEFVDGNLANKDPANTLPIHGSPGLAPANTPEGWDETRVPYGDGGGEDSTVNPPSFTRASGGVTLRGQNCGEAGKPLCVNTGGGGGGGGNIEKGGDASAVPLPEGIAGIGGSVFGLAAFRYGGDYLRVGAPGGGGGGGCPHVSGDYAFGIVGIYRFKNTALHAPGTGGGGGGGVLHLAVQNLTLRSSGRILARGGNAHQSIDVAGNGGGGAGGNVFIQVKNALTLEQGCVIDVRGGLANRPVPVLPGQSDVEYPGNIRVIAGNTRELGGRGGNGSPGRVRIEADPASIAVQRGLNSSYSGGPFLLDTAFSVGVSKPIRLGVGPGLVASTHDITVGKPVTSFFEFGQPPGTDSALLWQGSSESLDQHGAVAPFSQLTGAAGLKGTPDPANLRRREYVRFVVPFLSNGATQEAQAIREIHLPYSLELEAQP